MFALSSLLKPGQKYCIFTLQVNNFDILLSNLCVGNLGQRKELHVERVCFGWWLLFLQQQLACVPAHCILVTRSWPLGHYLGLPKAHVRFKDDSVILWKGTAAKFSIDSVSVVLLFNKLWHSTLSLATVWSTALFRLERVVHIGRGFRWWTFQRLIIH